MRINLGILITVDFSTGLVSSENIWHGKKTFETNENMDIDLGWHILKSQSENLWCWHNGGTGGYSSSMAIDEKSKDEIVILSNVAGFNPSMGSIDQL